ncbi:hypothetical protein VHUM_00246 [Vanrija humicola]|uniref:Protein YTP1-like C-terminal domain-containing protein n=1 Tax=Vanrija humicola TaxID=5417 RepID=A0A7D8Z7L7_VANHU|nr:hypothetical protein VHUM_00246 [Vanrija humicola]
MGGEEHAHEHEHSAAPTTTTAAATASALPAAAHAPGHHHHKGPVKTTLDDAEIHRWHTFPPTYLDADFRLTKDQAIFGEDLGEGWDPATVPSHPRLMAAHVVAMVLAYFGALPISLALRAASHPSHYLANGVFLAIAVFGWLAGVAYKAAMPDMYDGAKHGGMGSALVFLSIGLAVLDSLGLISSAVRQYRSGAHDWRAWFSSALAATREDKLGAARYEMVGLVHGDNDESGDEDDAHHRGTVFAIGDDDDEGSGLSRASPAPAPSRRSTGSEGTLHDHSPVSPIASSSSGSVARGHALEMDVSDLFEAEQRERTAAWAAPRPLAPATASPAASPARRAGEIALTWVRRTQVVLAYVCVLSGLPVYVGMCRGGYINTCAAHIIKGSIFFGYGVLTFARYLGAYADLGWAWNRRPAGARAISAEMVECFVIFLYGITNTWMERFGAQPGDPYSVKQVQHISIAVMFWFAGLSGMLLESPTIRRVLGAVMYAGRPGDRVRTPPSYAFSFNPLPALTIAITGLAMAAHHQDYVFQVEIHKLWGVLLAGGSMFRFLTYFFLWLRPPTESTLPSRPPTEVLTAFGWAAGGIVFMLSDEEIAFAAMRTGFDDMMAFLNVTVALTCLIFCWVVAVLAVKGYALLRVQRGVQLAADEGDARV